MQLYYSSYSGAIYTVNQLQYTATSSNISYTQQLYTLYGSYLEYFGSRNNQQIIYCMYTQYIVQYIVYCRAAIYSFNVYCSIYIYVAAINTSNIYNNTADIYIIIQQLYIQLYSSYVYTLYISYMYIPAIFSCYCIYTSFIQQLYTPALYSSYIQQQYSAAIYSSYIQQLYTAAINSSYIQQL